jgi:hypothetical protein
MRRWSFLSGAVLVLAAWVVHADEGMWTFNQFPSAKVGAAYGFTPGPEWLLQLQRSSVRIAGGCSASVVSPNGLVMTNHHCARECIQSLSGMRKKDFNKDGFIARKVEEELRCPGMEINQLSSITDVTQAVQDATHDTAPDKFNDVQKAVIAGIEKICATGDEWRCDVVTLFRGGQYNLYKYLRLRDIRLVFAPEDAIAFFGGDPDNFNFPRYDLDVAFLRIYDANGKPWKAANFLPFANTGIRQGELTFVSGNPGGTSRGMTVAQLEDQRDKALPTILMRLSQERGWLSEYQKRGNEQQRHSNDDLFGVENGLKALKGQHEALTDGTFFASLQTSEHEFRSKLQGDTALFTAYGDVWDNIAAITKKRQEMRKSTNAIQDTYGSILMDMARSILRHAEEKTKPNGERLPEFTDARLPQMVQEVLSDAPIYKELEVAKIRHGLTHLREDLGPDHPLVKKLLGTKSPEQMATELVRGCKLGELKTNAKGEPAGGLRKTLWDADSKTLAASKDPMLQFVASFDAEARAARKRFEEEVQGPLKQQEERMAKARFAVYGSDIYPDANFTLRLSYGRMLGWMENGTPVAPFTDIAGAYRRHTGAAPFALPPSWLKARSKVDLATPFNFVTTNDIIGGNSGSPIVNQNGELVGLVFDGNIHSLGGKYGFDEELNRTVAVDSRALLLALDHVYAAAHIAAEIRAGQK